MATVSGTAGNDFVHVQGDGQTPPSGYTDIPQATDSNDVITPGSGDDIIFAGGGDDTISFDANLTAADSVDGGAGFDTVYLNGNYDLTLAASTMTNVEKLALVGGGFLAHNTYHLVMNDGNVAAGETLSIDASRLGDADVLSFDGSAETDGNFNVSGGTGNFNIVTGAGNDVIGSGLAGTIDAGAGNDVVSLGSATIVDRTSIIRTGTYLDDSVHGGAGTDTLRIISANFDMSHFSAASSGFELLSGVNQVSGDNNANDLDFSGFGQTASSDTLSISGQGGDDTLTAWNFGASLNGGDGNDTLTGGAGKDVLIGGMGGDILHGGDGNDTLYAESADGSTHDSAGTVNLLYGENGDDILYSGAGDDTLDGGSGNDWASYRDAPGGVTVHLNVIGPQNVGAGAGTDTLVSIENLEGSQGNDTLIGNSGDNHLAGDDGNDILILDAGGNDIAEGDPGNDTFIFGAALTAADQVDGGDGNDTVRLNGDYSAGVNFGPQTMVNVETIFLVAGHSYQLTTNEATVAAGQTLTVAGGTLGAGDRLVFDGSHETNGNFIIRGGAGNDVLTGGAGNDTLMGGLGADHLTGGLGADIFVYTGVAQSTSVNYDTITRFDFANADKFDLGSTVSAIDTTVGAGALSTASFDTDLAASVDAAHLGKHHAVLFTPTSGDLTGKTFLIIDANGVAGYQAGKDLVIQLDHAVHLSGLDVTDFT